MSVVEVWSQPVDATLYLGGEMECGLMLGSSEDGKSLFGIEISLLPKIISLIIFLGKLHRNRCCTAAYRAVAAPKIPKIAKFPVIFAVSREICMETGSHRTAHTTIPSAKIGRHTGTVLSPSQTFAFSADCYLNSWIRKSTSARTFADGLRPPGKIACTSTGSIL